MRISDRLSDDGPADVGWRWRDLHGVVDFGLDAVRICGLSQVQGLPVGSGECRRCALQRPQGVAQGGPAIVVTEAFHARAQNLYGLVGDDLDEEVGVGPALLLVIDGTQAEFGFERPEHGPHVGEHGVRAPHLFRVPAEDVRTQAADAPGRPPWIL